jgi:hypothetical protein
VVVDLRSMLVFSRLAQMMTKLAGLANHGLHTFICVLIEAAESVDLVIAAVCDGRINETSRSLSRCSHNPGTAAVIAGPTAFCRAGWHQVGIVGRCGRGRSSPWRTKPIPRSSRGLTQAKK